MRFKSEHGRPSLQARLTSRQENVQICLTAHNGQAFLESESDFFSFFCKQATTLTCQFLCKVTFRRSDTHQHHVFMSLRQLNSLWRRRRVRLGQKPRLGLRNKASGVTGNQSGHTIFTYKFFSASWQSFRLVRINYRLT